MFTLKQRLSLRTMILSNAAQTAGSRSSSQSYMRGTLCETSRQSQGNDSSPATPMKNGSDRVDRLSVPGGESMPMFSPGGFIRRWETSGNDEVRLEGCMRSLSPPVRQLSELETNFPHHGYYGSASQLLQWLKICSLQIRAIDLDFNLLFCKTIYNNKRSLGSQANVDPC